MNPLLSLLSYRAFRPDQLDVDVPIRERFKKRRIGGANKLLLVSVGKEEWRSSIATFDSDGSAVFGEVRSFSATSTPDEISEWLRECVKKTEVDHVGVSIGFGWSPRGQIGLNRFNDLEVRRILREEPSRLFGDKKLEDDALHSLVYHPLVEGASILFSGKRKLFEDIMPGIQMSGLKVARVVCELAQMVDLAFAKKKPDELGEDSILILSGPSSIILLRSSLNGWEVIHFDQECDADTISGFIRVALNNIIPGQRIYYIDGGLVGMSDILANFRSHEQVNLGDNMGSFLSLIHN